MHAWPRAAGCNCKLCDIKTPKHAFVVALKLGAREIIVRCCTSKGPLNMICHCDAVTRHSSKDKSNNFNAKKAKSISSPHRLTSCLEKKQTKTYRHINSEMDVTHLMFRVFQSGFGTLNKATKRTAVFATSLLAALLTALLMPELAPKLAPTSGGQSFRPGRRQTSETFPVEGGRTVARLAIQNTCRNGGALSCQRDSGRQPYD